jgi:hypothetical protein
MDSLKEFLQNEIQSAVNQEMSRIKINNLNKTLVEAVNTASSLKNVNSKKYETANKVVKLIETRLKKEYKKYNESFEGEGEMLKAQLLSIMENAERIYHMIDESDTFEDWLQSKVTIAEDYLRAVNGYLKYFNGENHMKNDEIEDDELEYDDENYDWDDVEEDELDFEDDEDYDWDDEDFDEEEFDDEDEDDFLTK